MKSDEDAHGHVVYDLHHGISATEIVERDDGWIAASPGPSLYLAPFRKWPKHERAAMKYARGRVLDVGCGAGRACLYLQRRGQQVVGIDNSPLAIKTARLRGVRQTRLLSVTSITTRLGTFDTVLMLGNNFGLMGNRKRARWLLQRFASITSADGRIVAAAVDPYDTQDRDHRRYHRHNRSRGRMGGHIRVRVRYGSYCTPWFDWLLVSRREMRRLLAGTPWEMERYIESGGPGYVAVIRKNVAT
ncbi:MAG: class I SAM-dependent methyltransferase [Gemmatimonadota bacterium]|nr:MAG: class I SAM-dependent methyltransferase [Gemmatimonadota bacterium]